VAIKLQDKYKTHKDKKYILIYIFETGKITK